MSLHWNLHPKKDEAWYKHECSRMTVDEVARELDINYSLSVSGKVFPSFRRSVHVSSKQLKASKYLPVYRVWDFGKRTNAVLYAQIDSHNRVRCLFERLLGPGIDDPEAEGSSTSEQVEVALSDSLKFKDLNIIDICDPAGAVKGHNSDPDVDLIYDAFGSWPYYEVVKSLQTNKRTATGIKLTSKVLQQMPGGNPGLLVDQHGCPTLIQAFEGGVRFKKDTAGNTLDRIHEQHPYMDIMDCLFYLLIETRDGIQASDPEDFTPVSNDYPVLEY